MSQDAGISRILGIDPGLQHTGWGVIEAEGSRLRYIASGAIHPATDAALAERLRTLHDGVAEVIAAYQPSVSAIEQTFVSVNAASTLKLGNARGALLLSLALHGLAVHEYDATKIKKTVVGVGRAGKPQIAAMVGMLLPGVPDQATEDALDALAVAITHAHHKSINNTH